MRYLITGANGYIGNELFKYLRDRGEKVTGIGRKELNADLWSLQNFFMSFDVIFHAAGIKGISYCNENVTECIDSNIELTKNIIKTSKEAKVHHVVGISSIRVNPIEEVYGATKFLSEQLLKEANDEYTNFKSIRLPNIIGSPNSVFDLWKRQLVAGEQISITSETATRFICSPRQASIETFMSINCPKQHHLVTPQFRAATLGDIAKVMIAKYSLCHMEPKVIGLRPYEHEHEYISKDMCSKDAERFTIKDLEIVL